MRSSLDHFDAAVEHGGSVLSAEGSVVLSMVKEATQSGYAATFYVTKSQFDAIVNWYWTPERRKSLKVEPVSIEERQRIESELGVKDSGFHYSNRITCDKCGSHYGAFEFVLQGIREHGREIVEAALTLSNAGIIRVNSANVAVCQTCRAPFSGGTSHYYSWERYSCCRMELT
jgi:hypothetical protein